LSLFAYFAVVCVEKVQWATVAKELVMPRLSFERGFWMMVVAILGTTISPYLFFWQAAQEVEDTKAKPEREPLREKPSQGPAALGRIQLDTLVGMGFSNVVALAIMISAAATLHRSGMHEISSAADAAEALRPVAGHFAFALFALGILGTGLLSVPVLAGSAAYALGEARRWPVGLSRSPRQAKAFYGAILVATFLGAAANAFAVNAVDALVWAAIINALVAVPVMALLVLMGSDSRIMKQFAISRSWKVLGWIATAVMAIAGIAFVTALVTQKGG
jgi:Mn2+/Fe2+ NRAMP family transporter